MAKGTRSGNNATTGQPSAPKTRKAPTVQLKEKARAIKTEAEANERPNLAEMMEGAPSWARALFRHIDGKIDMLGDYVQDMDGRMDTFRTQLDELAQGSAPGDDHEVDDVVEMAADPETNGVDDVEKWAKLVERFNKLKPVAFDGKGDLTVAQR